MFIWALGLALSVPQHRTKLKRELLSFPSFTFCLDWRYGPHTRAWTWQWPRRLDTSELSKYIRYILAYLFVLWPVICVAHWIFKMLLCYGFRKGKCCLFNNGYQISTNGRKLEVPSTSKKRRSCQIFIKYCFLSFKVRIYWGLEICNGTGRFANEAGGPLPREALIKNESDWSVNQVFL